MIVFERMIEAVKRMESGMKTAVRGSLQQSLAEASIIDWNVEQMLSGQDSEDKPIDPPYRPLTIEIKKIKGQPYDKVTLRDEGDFHHGTIIEWGDNSFFITSTDPKTTKLTKKYGWQIFGLNDEHYTDLQEQFTLPYLLEYCRQELAKR